MRYNIVTHPLHTIKVQLVLGQLLTDRDVQMLKIDSVLLSAISTPMCLSKRDVALSNGVRFRR